MEKSSPIIIALDFPDAKQALSLVEQLDPTQCRVKVGKQLFTCSGPALIEKLVALNFDVFLDLKFHDIPNTVANACRSAAELGVWMLNVHALGGSEMMRAAKDALNDYDTAPLLIAVTLLTSLSAEDLLEIGIQQSPQQMVLRLAQLAQQQGLDGVVCSAREVAMLRNKISTEFNLVTPGIRPSGIANADQKRVMTPANALAAGSDYLVIGRAIIQAANPAFALAAIMDSLKQNHNDSEY